MNNKVKKLLESINDDEAFLITSPENVFCLSGFSGEGVLVICAEKSAIVTDFRYIEAAQTNKAGLSVENVTRGIENIIGTHIKTVIIEEDSLTVSRYRTYEKKLSWAALADGSERINKLRLIKDKNEISKIKTAAQIATAAFVKVVESMAVGVSERQLALMFERLVKEAGASRLSFDTIVASGENSSMPHAGVTDRRLCRGDFVTFDFGCVYEGYCSDMTRTVAVGSVSEEQKNVYEIVKTAQEEAVKAAVSGTKCRYVDAAARRIIGDAGYFEAFGHALGHGVGVLVHEQPRLSSKSEQVLENGMVVTAEPGIYLSGRFGVRIEDLLVITGEKPLNLSDFQKDLLII